MKRAFVQLMISGLLLLGGYSFGQQFHYVSIDVQCAATARAGACPAGLMPGQVADQTSAHGVNQQGDIVGVYVASGVQHGFLLRDERFISLDFPGQFRTAGGTFSPVRATVANGINARGEIVGQYVLPVNDPMNPVSPEDSELYCPSAADAACIKGFLYRDGEFSTVLFPGHPGAVPQRITSDGTIYGCLHDHDTGMSMFGAIWKRFGTASLMADGLERTDGVAMPMSMNNGATPNGHMIGGLWVDMAKQQHGLLVKDGVFQSYDPTPTTTLTAIWDMSPNEQFVGTYVDAGTRHGFLQPRADRDGVFPPAINIDFSPGGLNTIAFGINEEGVIVGQYLLASGGPHGFAAVPICERGFDRDGDER